MKRIFGSILTLISFQFSIADAANWAAVEKEFNALYTPNSSAKDPGYILSVSGQAGTLLQITSGAADIEQGALINEETVFHIASLSKQITGAALAHAIIDGKVSLEDKLAKWLPRAGKYGGELKVKHLVYMTSGLTEYTNVTRTSKQPWATFHYFSIDEAINASFSVDKLSFQPGTRWQYSNINFMLLTEIVARAYDQPFSQVVEEKIFSPLGMEQSLINDDVTQLVPNRANAYIARTKPALRELNVGAKIKAKPGSAYILIRRNSPHYGGSGVMTSMNDWVKWQSEVIMQKKLGKQFWQTMLQTMRFKHPKENDAFGIVHGTNNDNPTLWYAGGDIDVSSYAVVFPDQELSISCFSNNPSDSCSDKVTSMIEVIGGL